MKKLFMGIALAAMTGLGACSTVDIDSTEKMAVKGFDFEKTLHAEYVRLARLELDESDWDDAKYFNDKAKMVAMGKMVLPQEVSERQLPTATMKQAVSDRGKLMSALVQGRSKTPQLAAKAQAGFDCWLQEVEENDQPEDIAACRKQFEGAMAMMSMAEPMAMPADDMIIFFGLDSASLDDQAMAVVKQAVAASKGAKKMVISGHTDTSGSAEYNMLLSKARVIAVWNALLEAGLDKSVATKEHHGMSRPRIKTGLGVVEAGNRRVEIDFQ